MECICPQELKDIPADKRVLINLPSTPTLTYVFHKDCPIHGYSIVETEKEENNDLDDNGRLTQDL